MSTPIDAKTGLIIREETVAECPACPAAATVEPVTVAGDYLMTDGTTRRYGWRCGRMIDGGTVEAVQVELDNYGYPVL